MKTIILSSFAIILSLFSTQAQAQDHHGNNERNYVVLTRKIPQLKPIILTAKSLAEEDGKDLGDFQVVVCGKTVSGLQDKEKMAPYLEMAGEAGVHIKACGFSLKKFGVESSKLPEEIEVVKNGILHNFRLQKKGYLSIEL